MTERMKLLAQFVCVATLFLFNSCDGINQSVKGIWSIDEMQYKNENLLYDILLNVIIFKKEECKLPAFFENHLLESKEHGTWEVIQKGEKYFLTIKTDNEIF